MCLHGSCPLFIYVRARVKLTVSTVIFRVVSGDNGFIKVQWRFTKLKELRVYLHQPCQQLSLPPQVGDLHAVFLRPDLTVS